MSDTIALPVVESVESDSESETSKKSEIVVKKRRQIEDTDENEPNKRRKGIDSDVDKCFNCGKPGHFSRECPTVKCFYCGLKGHTSNFCPEKIRERELRATYAPYSFYGYPSPYGYPFYPYLDPYDPSRVIDPRHRDDRCFACGRVGHLQRECPEARHNLRCYNCCEKGHISKDCPQEQRPDKCFNCGERGHHGKECPHGNKPVCYTCGKADHLSINCPEKHEVCYNCGKEGHFSKECPEPLNLLCHFCKEKGHKAIHCPRAIANDRSLSPLPGVSISPTISYPYDPYAAYRAVSALVSRDLSSVPSYGYSQSFDYGNNAEAYGTRIYY